MLIVCGFSKKKTTCGVHQLAKKKQRQYNGGKWTEGRFTSFVTSILRGGSRRWEPKWTTLNNAKTEKKKNVKTGRLAQHYRCAICQEDFPLKEINVDHIVPIGTEKTWDEFIERLFCEADNLQAVCVFCHKVKTRLEKLKSK